MLRILATDFITTRTGKYAQFPAALDPAQTHQCVALFYDYTRTVNTGEPYPGGNGSDLWVYPWESYDHIPATDTPVFGDWASWSGTVGAYTNGGAGHTAMWVAPHNTTSGYFFTQNPAPADKVLLQYAGIQGYLRMRVAPMSMNVIDVSRYQAGANLGSTGSDAVTVGLTFGNAGANPYADDEIQRARNAGMLTGLYHIRAGDGPTPEQEADWFVSQARPYLDGRTPVFLDWEECTLSDVAWAALWIDEVKRLTGLTAVIYMSASVSNAYDWSPVRARDVGLWVAQYPYNTVSGFAGVNWTPPATSWDVLVGWQYCGTGGSIGSMTNVDTSVFYLTPNQWVAYGTPAGTVTTQSDDVTPIVEDEVTQADIDSIVNAVYKFTTTLFEQYHAVTRAYLAKVTGDTGAATNTAVLAGLDAAVAKITADAHTAAAAAPAAVLNQTFTTTDGATTNLPGLLDKINSKPAGTVTLSATDTATIAAAVAAAVPPVDPAVVAKAVNDDAATRRGMWK